jgi:hypothetical protein
MATHVAENSTHGRQQGRQYGEARRKFIAAMLCNMFNFMVVRAMHVKSVSRHKNSFKTR